MRIATGMVFVVAAALAAGCPGKGPGGTGMAPLGKAEFFLLSVEQDGRALAVEDHQAHLARRPFTLVFTFPKAWTGMMVNASLRPDLLASMQAHRSMASVPRRGMPEDLRNPRQAIFVNDQGYNHWYYFGAATHCFDEMIERADDYVCRRKIANTAADNDSPGEPVAEFSGEKLYLTFVQADLVGGRRVVRYADYLTLVFR